METLPPEKKGPAFLAALGRKNALRAAFGLVVGLGVASMLEAIHVQTSLSDATADIYQQHIRQDEVMFDLRRALWLATGAARDYLIDPSPNRRRRYESALRSLYAHVDQKLDELAPLAYSGELRRRSMAFWKTLEQLPDVTEKMTPEARYEFIQRDIAEQRSVLGDFLRDWSTISQNALTSSEERFADSRSSAATRLAWILGASLLFGTIVAVVVIRYSENLESRAAEHMEELMRNRDELTRLSLRLMEVQEEERARLARELHDEIGQSLATFRLEVARAETLPDSRASEIKPRLRRARELADSTVQTVRDICLLLRPSMLDDLGLIPAIQWLAEDFSRRSGVPCEFSSSNVSDELPEPVLTCVYRVVQEALHNCEKHAGATLVTVRLEQAENHLTATIEDNGRGFCVDMLHHPSTRHFGLLGMRERATALHGELQVDSADNNGTTIRLSVPVLPTGIEPTNKDRSVVA